MISPAAKPNLAPVIAMPVFDDHRHLLVEWFERLENGGVRKVIPAASAVCIDLQRVRRSPRHARLAEFLGQALTAMRNDEIEGARYILLTALATFGWSSHLGM